MFRSYLKVGLRQLSSHASHSVINITGLAAGITCCLFIVLYISDELSYDRYHVNADRIHRISMDNWAGTPAALAPSMMASYPHLTEDVVRIWPLFAPAKLRRGDVVFVESGGVFADPDVFSVFSWPFLSGNPSTALSDANAIVLTESSAKKYFGNADPIGEDVVFWGGNKTVTGVIKDLPANSHLQFDFLISFPTLKGVMGNDVDQNWGTPAFYTYALLKDGVTTEDISKASSQLFMDHRAGEASSPVVQPVTSIHLYSKLEGEFSPGGNIAYLFTLGTAAVIVLLLACINFTNLSTVRAATRTKEVGIRKVMGAMRHQLVVQFFGETTLLSLAAFILAVAVVVVTLPGFNQLAGKDIGIRDLMKPGMALALVVIVILIGLVAGSYPALFLSRFNPVAVLKSSGNLRVANFFVRKGLIVVQFTISTVFLVGMAVIILQLRYLQDKDLGFDRKQVLVMDGDNFQQVKTALQGVAGVQHVAGIPQMMGDPLPMSRYKAQGHGADTLHQMRYYTATGDFVETMGIKVLAGRSFIDGSQADMRDSYVLNESAIVELGWDAEEAIGKTFSMFVATTDGGKEKWRDGKVIGVIKDFHYEALYKQIAPIVLFPGNDLNLTLVSVDKITPGLLESVQEVWRKTNPDAPFNYYFLDDHLRKQYDAEMKLGTFMGAATALAVLIASLGLFALVAFSAGQRTKEIGIRKVLGATVGQIVALLSNDFLKLVGLAVILAMPIAYVAMSRWLDNFAYHIPLSWTTFLAAGLLAILIAILTVSFQSLKAAHADPAESIRYE